jgi:hypothetical protein
VGKRRRDGRTKALEMVTRRGRMGASALDIGDALAEAMGPRQRRGFRRRDREAAGLAEGLRLVRAGLAVPTRGNLFMLAKHEGKAVPPAVEADGIRRSYPRPSGTFGAASRVRVLVKDGRAVSAR